MKRVGYFFRAILLGLVATQALATLQVYLSNASLHEMVTAVAEAGYLAVPNKWVAPSLKNFGSAFCGGIFFTFSLGAGLSLMSAAFAWAWARIFNRSRVFLLSLILLWMVVVVAANIKGFSFMATSSFLAVPLIVFSAVFRWMPKQIEKGAWINWATAIAPVILLSVVWSAHGDRFLLLDIRDYLLLSNPVGKAVDDFYYRFTLYPAHLFKTLDQKNLKTCRLIQSGEGSSDKHAQIKEALVNYDYLPVIPSGPVDLEVVKSEKRLEFRHQGRALFSTSPELFLSNPQKVLKRFSADTDRNALLRHSTFIGLLLGFPLFLYALTFTLVRFVAEFFAGPRHSVMIAAALCLLIGFVLMVPLLKGRSESIHAADLAEELTSGHWQERVRGLRRVVSDRLEIYDLKVGDTLMNSPYVPERYWLAKALGVSRHEKTYEILLSFLDDPHPNVVSMGFYAIGQRGDKRAVNEILKRIEASDHWYNQWYAYRALRALGWRQKVN